MKIKTKIRLGFALIFVVVLLFGGLSIYFVNQLSKTSRVILKNNYATLSFAKEMRTILDENNIPLSNTAKTSFNNQLVKQENNITEKGEDVATAALRKAFNALQSSASTLAQQQTAERSARVALRKIEDLNMQAVVRKTDAAQNSVNNATIILGLIGCFTFLALFSFSVNITGFIAEPLITLTDGLEEISRKNYEHRLNFSESDEFGEVAAAFNAMATHLKDDAHQSQTAILAIEQRIETIIEQVHDAIIVLNEQQEILFINTTAQNLLNLHEHKLPGKPARQFTSSNDLFRSILESKDNNASLKIEYDGKESLYKLASFEISIPNITTLKTDELNIARVPAGKIYVLRNLTELQAI